MSRSICSLIAVLLGVVTFACSQDAKSSDADYIAQATSAAPSAIAKDAAVVRMEGGTMRTLRPGTNGFTCMVMGPNKMCNDANSMEFFHAMMTHAAPPEKVGVSYMLAGDDGASNTDPYATGKTADNHWIKTGPHIMLVGGGAKQLGYTRAKDPDPTQPYMMWAGTPYEHAMVPTSEK